MLHNMCLLVQFRVVVQTSSIMYWSQAVCDVTSAAPKLEVSHDGMLVELLAVSGLALKGHHGTAVLLAPRLGMLKFISYGMPEIGICSAG